MLKRKFYNKNVHIFQKNPAFNKLFTFLLTNFDLYGIIHKKRKGVITMLSFYLSLIETEEDRAQFEKIYAEYLDWMVRMAYHYTKNIHDSEEIVHDVFLSIANSKTAVPTEDAEKTKSYLFVCLRNRVNKLMKANSRIQTVELEKFFDFHSDDDTEKTVIFNEAQTEVKAFIATMNPIYKDVLTQHLSDGRSLRDIAQDLDLPLNTVATRFKRGRAMLRERFPDLNI